MTDRHELLQTTTKLLKACLDSLQKPCPLDQLQIQYKNCVGQTIPFRQLGFVDLEEFLKSIPETAEIIKEDSGKTFVKAASLKETEHIEKLVKEQKSSDQLQRRHHQHGQRNRNHQQGKHRFSTHSTGFSGSKVVPYGVQSQIVRLLKEHNEV